MSNRPESSRGGDEGLRAVGTQWVHHSAVLCSNMASVSVFLPEWLGRPSRVRGRGPRLLATAFGAAQLLMCFHNESRKVPLWLSVLCHKALFVC